MKHDANFVTTLSPQDFAVAAKQIGFDYLDTTSFCTTYRNPASDDLISIAEPTAEVYETLEVWADCRFTPEQREILKIRFSTAS